MNPCQVIKGKKKLVNSGKKHADKTLLFGNLWVALSKLQTEENVCRNNVIISKLKNY